VSPISINPLPALGTVVVALLLGVSAGWVVNGWRLDAKVAGIESTQAKAESKQASDTVKTMKVDAESIHTAAVEFTAIKNDIGPKLDALKKELKNAKALPPGCRPDDVRVRSLDAAIEAANKAATGP